MKTSFSQTRSRTAGLLAVSIVAAAVPVTIFASPAEALSASCTAWKTKIERTGLDPNYVSARCSSIGATTKVRGTLNVNNDTDRHTSYFTVVNTTYSSATINCVFGCSATYEKASR